MKNVYAKYLFCTCKYLLHTVLLQMIHEQVCVIIKIIKSINLLIQNSRQHKNYIFLAKPFLSDDCLHTAQTVSTNSKNDVSADVQWKSKYYNNNWSNQISEL